MRQLVKAGRQAIEAARTVVRHVPEDQRFRVARALDTADHQIEAQSALIDRVLSGSVKYDRWLEVLKSSVEQAALALRATNFALLLDLGQAEDSGFVATVLKPIQTAFKYFFGLVRDLGATIGNIVNSLVSGVTEPAGRLLSTTITKPAFITLGILGLGAIFLLRSQAPAIVRAARAV